ncbi:hypothetical protein F1559_002788 [Cyanidiococcus yangmingshanensis]|uniref:Uncharacterized protein n=1 Tax=Cyanidiococcus yangmingshanensis TaxID=2690220 RepID=A0A7J7IEY2_9RHOD|nr:hypothetical protein F1559_002788 [Cyanidiococcus yangmingshanensis]
MSTNPGRVRVSLRAPTPMPLRIYLCFLESGVDLLDGLCQFLDQASLPMAFTLSSYGVLALGHVRKPLEPFPGTPEAILDEFHERLGMQRECYTYDTPQRLEPIIGEPQWSAWQADRERPPNERLVLPLSLDGAASFRPFKIEPVRWFDQHDMAHDEAVVVSYIQGGRRRTFGDRFFLFASGRLQAVDTAAVHANPSTLPTTSSSTTSSPSQRPVANQLDAHAVQVGLLDHGTRVGSLGVRVAFGMAVADDLGNSWMHVARLGSGSEFITAVRTILEKRALEAVIVLGCMGHVRDIHFRETGFEAEAYPRMRLSATFLLMVIRFSLRAFRVATILDGTDQRRRSDSPGCSVSSTIVNGEMPWRVATMPPCHCWTPTLECLTGQSATEMWSLSWLRIMPLDETDR